MAFTTYSLTGDIADTIGADFTPGKVIIYLSPSAPVFTDGGSQFRVGDIAATIANDGTFTIAGIPDSTTTTVTYRATVRWQPADGSRTGMTSGYFSVTANGTLAAVWNSAVNLTPITPATVANIAAAAALGTTNNTATASFVTGAGATKTALDAAYARVTGRPINARDNGVLTSTTDASVPLNTLLTANPGATIVVPPGNYTMRADKTPGPGTGVGGGINIIQAGTTLDLTGATFTMAPASTENYQMIDIRAADVTLIGGRLVGDVGSHIGTTGEYGHGINIGAGADRAKVIGTYVTKCWGDGILIWEDPKDVELVGCVCDDNRRQGLSIIDATRPKVIGGFYINTGLTARTAPAGGIDIEPDAATTRDVSDALIVGVTVSGNAGPGIMASSSGRTLSGLIANCVASGNGSGGISGFKGGFWVVGATNTIRMVGCVADNNTGDGFLIDPDVLSARLQACVSDRNTMAGYRIQGDRARLIGCDATANAHMGIEVASTADGTKLVSCCVESSDQANAGFANFDIVGPNARLTGCVSDAGILTQKPDYGYLIRSTGTSSRLMGCDVAGTHAVSAYLDQTSGAGTFSFPTPGIGRQPANANTSGVALAALETEVNELKQAFRNLGLMS